MIMYYPVMLNLSGRLVVIIGGGTVAARKVRELIESGAIVHIISPEINEEIDRLITENRKTISFSQRTYKKGDLLGAALVYSTTDNPEVNKNVYGEAEEHNIFINAVDDPENCSFIVPSVIRRGDLVVAVSTSGNSPAMAARLRRELEKNIPSSIEATLAKLKEIRSLLREDTDFTHLTSSQRGELLKKIVNDDSIFLSLTAALNNDALKKIIRSLI